MFEKHPEAYLRLEEGRKVGDISGYQNQLSCTEYSQSGDFQKTNHLFISKISNTHVKKPQANKMDKYNLQSLISSETDSHGFS